VSEEYIAPLKYLIRLVRGFKSMKATYATIKGFEVMRALRKGQSAIFNLTRDIRGEARSSALSALGACALTETVQLVVSDSKPSESKQNLAPEHHATSPQACSRADLASGTETEPLVIAVHGIICFARNAIGREITRRNDGPDGAA
jgi:hypothetical protein